MTSIPYTYCVVRYAHDPAAGEVLNAGVILYAPAGRILKVRVEERYKRFSAAFRDFDGDVYRHTLRRLKDSVEEFRNRQAELFTATEAPPEDVLSIGRQFWADDDLSFQFGPVRSGLAHDLDDAVEHLFRRFVGSQVPTEKEGRRSNEDVWSVFHPHLSRLNVTAALQEKTIRGDNLELKFEHAFKNSRWHVLQPLSLDYQTPEQIQRQAALWLGYGAGLVGAPDLGRLILLLGPPQIQIHRRAYENAKALLNKLPIRKELVEEDGAADFARHIADYLQLHGQASASEGEAEGEDA